MKRFNFGTFVVDDSNRRAFQICQDIAELKPVSPCPVVLLGDEGCGKTHLLYSIVNRIRAGTTKTGLAYVTAVDFPDQVRHLIDDPSPVERAQSAVLLVDQLERFNDLIDELEAVVRIFLDHKHYVVLATKVHPGRLQHLSQGFRDIINAGQIVRIVPRGAESQVETIRRQVRDEADAQLAKKQQEVDELRSLLNRVGKETAPEAPANVAALRAELEAERIAKADLGRKLAEARETAQAAQEELDVARGTMQTAASQASALHAEMDRLRPDLARIKELERLADALREEADQARMEAAENLDTARALHEQLEQTRAEAGRHVIAADEAQELIDKANSDAASARERAETLVAELGLIRTALQTERDAAGEVKAKLEQSEAEAAEIRGQFDRLREEADRDKSSQREKSAELDTVREDRDRARDEAGAARDRLASVQQELHGVSAKLAQEEDAAQQLRDQIRQVQSESDAWRSQANALRTETDELRKHVAAVSEETGQARAEIESMRAVMADADALQSELADVKAALDGARKDAADLQHERDTLDAKVVALNAQAAESQSTHAALMGRLESVLAQVESHRANSLEQGAAYRAHIDELESLIERHARAAVDPEELAMVRAQADETVAQLETLRRDFQLEREELSAAGDRMREDYETRMKTLYDELQSTRREAEDVDAEREKYRVELEKTKREHEALRVRADELDQARESAASSFLDAERDREQLRASVAQAQEQRHKFQTEAAKLRAERDAVRGKLDQAENRNEELQHDLDAARRNAASAQSLAGELEGRVARLETERETLKQTAQKLQQQMEQVASNLMQSGQAFFAALGSNPAGVDPEPDEGPGPRNHPPSPARRNVPDAESWGPGGASVLRPLDELAPLEEEGGGHSI